jgi:hypothetical protein
MAQDTWAVVAVLLGAFAMVAICTASVAYWAGSAHGLWSMLVFAVLKVSSTQSVGSKS